MTEPNLSVLVIDDNPFDVRLLKELIVETKVPVTIRIAKNGEQGMSELLDMVKDPPLPDLIFLDLNMPGESGHFVLDFIRGKEALAKVKVIVYTGSVYRSDEYRAWKNKADAYLIKPSGRVEMEAATKKLRRILETLRTAKG
jgi:chemotaxis family two-component system response regulator Rcp1